LSYASNQKQDAHVNEMNKQLGTFNTQFGELSKEAESLSDDAKEKFKGQFEPAGTAPKSH
jgi:phage-related minor tail protein